MQTDSPVLMTLQTQAAFNQLVSRHDYVVIYLTAAWCEPCQRFSPVLTEVAAHYPAIHFAQADIEVATDLAANFQVRQVPALMVVRDQVVVDMVVGEMKAHELNHHLQMWSALPMQAVNAHFDTKAHTLP